jgi:hypothetical protein
MAQGNRWANDGRPPPVARTGASGEDRPKKADTIEVYFNSGGVLTEHGDLTQ